MTIINNFINISNELIVYCTATFVHLFSFHFFFPFEVFQCTKCKFVLVLRIFFFFFFKHKLHTGQILNFGQYLLKRPKTLEIDWNNPKFFRSKIGIPLTKFLESPLILTITYFFFYFDWWARVLHLTQCCLY